MNNFLINKTIFISIWELSSFNFFSSSIIKFSWMLYKCPYIFNNLIYRFFNNSNKNVYLLTDEFIHSKTFNMDIINLNPDTYFLSIICHCFIYKE